MTYTATVKVYKSGNSKVITIPAKLDVEEGDEFKLKAKKGVVELRKVKRDKTKKRGVDLAGVWDNETGDLIEKHAKEFRKNFRFIRE